LADFYNCGVYRIRNIQTNDVYIGSSKDLEGRRKEHFCNLGKGAHCNWKLQAAWNLFGPDAFLFEVLVHCSESELFFHEQAALDSRLDTGYNISIWAGAPMRGRKASEATRALQSSQRKGVPKSSAHRLAIGVAHLGMRRSSQARRNMSVSQLGHANTENQLKALEKGRVTSEMKMSNPEYFQQRIAPLHTPKAKQKKTEAMKGHSVSVEARLRSSVSNKGQRRSESACQNMSNGWTSEIRATASQYQKQTTNCGHCGKGFNAGNLKRHLYGLQHSQTARLGA